MPRELRNLVAIEVAAVAVTAAVSVPFARAVPLLAFASLSRWVRGRTWLEVARGPAAYAWIGAVAGTAALVLALAFGGAAVELVFARSVEWSSFPMVRGSGNQLFAIAVLLGASAVASELVLRGWIVERALELRVQPVIAVMIGGAAEALLADGDVATRIGAFAFGAGLGWMYVAGGRSVIAPTCARLAFVLGAVALEAMRAIG